MAVAVGGMGVPAFGVLLAILGGSSLFLSTRVDASATATVLKGNFPVDRSALDRLEIGANNSPSLVISPAAPGSLALSNRVDSPQFSCVLHSSSNGGSTWTKVALPLQEPAAKCFDPEAAFGGDGTLYLSFVTLADGANRPDAVWITSSDDGGRTLSAPQPVLGPLAYQVRLLADPQAGRLYLFWLQAHNSSEFGFPEASQPILLARSDDGARTWQGPVRVTPPVRERVLAPSPALGPNGELYLLYLDLGEDSMDYSGEHGARGGKPYNGRWQLVSTRSVDRGAKWSEAVVDGGIVPTRRILPFLPEFPSVAVDQKSGALYAAFHDGRADVSDVFLWKSADGGATWGRGNRVNDTPIGDNTSQYLPAADVAPDGRVDVLYYDRRRDRKNVKNEVSLQFSYDEGENFSRRLKISNRSFDSRIGFGRERGLPELGSRLALLSTDRTDLAVWADTRAGTLTSGKQDLSRALVTFHNPGIAERALHYALRFGGGAMVLGAVLLVASWARSRARIGRRQKDGRDWVDRLRDG